MTRIAMVAGELSGDVLGADLLRALRRRYPEASFEGIGGPAMLQEGLRSLYDLENLSVMGLVEVLRHLPRLLRIRRALKRRWRHEPPDLFVGIDSPDFNLGLERSLRRGGVRTAHYVSPSVWAWRQNRIRGIAQAVDHMLTLLPFEARFYETHGIPVTFVGHPAADRFPLECAPAGYRRRLGLPETARILAILPGSRASEVERLVDDFMETAALLTRCEPDLLIVVPVAHAGLRERVERAANNAGVDAHLLDTGSELALGACDVVLTASGTATLEAMLLKRPMVVAYRVSAATAWIARRLRLVHTPFFALPNLLAQQEIVPEFIQEAVQPAAMSEALLKLLHDPFAVADLRQRFTEQHRRLRRGAGERAATALAELLER